MKSTEYSSISRRLAIILAITASMGGLLVVGMLQASKGARFHYLNSLHLKYVIELTELLAPSHGTEPALPNLRQVIKDIRTQPEECLEIISPLDRRVMQVIGSETAIELCKRDVQEADRLLALVDSYERGDIDATELTQQLHDGIARFYTNSDEFIEPIAKTTDAIIFGTFSLLGILSVGMLFTTVLMTRGIASAVRRQRGMELDLRKSEERWKFALEGAGDGVWDWNIPTGEVIYSSRLKEMLGYGETDFGNRVEEWQSRVHPEDWPSTRESLQAYFNGGIPSYWVEHRLLCKDGSWKWILDRGMIVSRDDGNKPLRMIGTHTDISRRVEAEEARRNLESELRQSQKLEAIGTLAGGIAHEFNNILTVILGNLELAQQELSPGHPALESLTQIHKSGERARDLVQQILIFSRRQTQRFKTVRLNVIVAEALKLLKATIPARVALRATLTEKPLHICADEPQIHQILINLCINAWQAMEEQRGHIDVVLDEVIIDSNRDLSAPGLEPGSYAHLVVRDDGKGMDDAVRQRIFEPFFTTKPVGQGTGLGLAVVHGIVQAHSGAITTRSQPGHGTSFELFFPIVDELVESPATSERSVISGAGKRILYVDDDAMMTHLVKRLLAKCGFEVTVFEDPWAALSYLRHASNPPDLVITDYTMPFLSGLELSREILSLRPDMPIVLISGLLSDTLYKQADQAGVKHVLFKPNSVEELCETVQRIVMATGSTRLSVI